MILFYIFMVNKTHEQTKTNNVLFLLSALSNFPTLSVALSPKPIGSY